MPSPSREITIAFSSVPWTYSSRIASPVGDATSASCRWRSTSSSDSTRNNPRCPPLSTGFSTAGKPTSSTARRVSDSVRTAANRGCGTPASARRRRIAVLCVIRCAVSAPIPCRPRASATAATTGTARSSATVSTPSIRSLAVAFSTAPTSATSTTFAMSASASPGASGFRSTAATRRPSSFARRIARRWWRPAPTKRTVRTDVGSYFGASADRSSSSVPSTSIGAPKRAACCTAIPSKTIPRNRPSVSSGTSSRISPASCRCR